MNGPDASIGIAIVEPRGECGAQLGRVVVGQRAQAERRPVADRGIRIGRAAP